MDSQMDSQVDSMICRFSVCRFTVTRVVPVLAVLFLVGVVGSVLVGTASAEEVAEEGDRVVPVVSGPVTVVSDSMEVTGGGAVFTFKGNVMAKESFILCSDALEVDRSGEGGDVLSIVATGNVRFLSEGKTGRSDRAVYDGTERTIILTGGAEVGRCSDRLTGESITFFLDDGRSVVEGGEGSFGDGGGRVKAVIMPGGGDECEEDAPSEEDFCKRSR